jgi:hypothetical protein
VIAPERRGETLRRIGGRSHPAEDDVKLDAGKDDAEHHQHLRRTALAHDARLDTAARAVWKRIGRHDISHGITSAFPARLSLRAVGNPFRAVMRHI